MPAGRLAGMDVLDIPVCPGCGAPAVGDARCSHCGTTLEGLDRLPTRREWELSQPAPGDPGWGTYPPPDDEVAEPTDRGLRHRLGAILRRARPRR